MITLTEVCAKNFYEQQLIELIPMCHSRVGADQSLNELAEKKRWIAVGIIMITHSYLSCSLNFLRGEIIIMRKEQKYFRELTFIFSQQSLYIILCSLETNFCYFVSACQIFFFFLQLQQSLLNF